MNDIQYMLSAKNDNLIYNLEIKNSKIEAIYSYICQLGSKFSSLSI